ncbi:hypothetical protein L5515_014845 [Caenorhabditis briggsae]|uniref:Uncharacterized protein n=1 Tax=Caenorhabditis briggsae TaxID=6238 RepID=A0AAE9EH95_CAEBR|nr:hypothetical protein L5515_014845 [Caenorhabditis briggsae]
MSQVAATIPKRSYRKEAIIVVAVAGVAIIVWNLRDKLSDLFTSLAFSTASNSATISEKSSSEVPKSSEVQDSSPKPNSVDIAPESVAAKSSSSEKADPPKIPAEQPPKEVVGNTSPESTENPKNSVYVGLPKADPTTVSTSIQPPSWPGATPR